jgi:putative FmdB family regulatory protein
MPLYEYECKDCGRRTEKIQKFSDAPLTACPHCGGAVEKVLHAPAIAFKGGGWYADLYSSGKRSSSGEKSGEGGAEKASGGASTTGDNSGGSVSKESAPANGSAPSAPAAPATAPPSSGTRTS